jgi:CspA family cold shock protein
MRGRVLRGTVADFDEQVGLGTVVRGDGTRYPFHCTQIADGSRSIDPGVTVEFDVIPGHRGQWEAAALRRC